VQYAGCTDSPQHPCSALKWRVIHAYARMNKNTSTICGNPRDALQGFQAVGQCGYGVLHCGVQLRAAAQEIVDCWLQRLALVHHVTVRLA